MAAAAQVEAMARLLEQYKQEKKRLRAELEGAGVPLAWLAGRSLLELKARRAMLERAKAS